MGRNYYQQRVSDLKRCFISTCHNINRPKHATGNDIKRTPEADIGNRKKTKYVRHDTIKVKVYAYQNPELLNPVDQRATWYKDGKVVETGQHWVIVLTNGYRVKYSVQVYTFKGIPNNDRKIQQLINVVRANRKGTYHGWLHHANLYWQVNKSFYRQIPINYYL